MAILITEDDVDSLGVVTTPEQCVRDAQTLEGWLADTERYELVPPLTAAAVMVAVAEHYSGAGRHDDALDWYRRAVEDGGRCTPDARAPLIGELLVAGRADEAIALADDVRRTGLDDGSAYEYIAAAFEAAGDTARALRWFSMGIVAIERGRAEESGAHGTLLVGRRRVRTTLGMPEDELDAEALEYLSALRSGWD